MVARSVQPSASSTLSATNKKPESRGLSAVSAQQFLDPGV